MLKIDLFRDLIDPQLLSQLHKPVPRYTSYPTAVDWGDLTSTHYLNKLYPLEGPLSLYIHIPFCERMCLYCGCSVILNRKQENEERYVESLLQEIDLVSQALREKKQVVQIHFGGGTPTKLSAPLLTKIMRKLESCFTIDYTQEVAIEVDPRTTCADEGAKLRLLKELGFNRISFGVQDTNEKVQEAVKRRQSWEMTQKTFFLAKQLGFDKINIDLIYGLPFQTQTTFKETIRHIMTLKPDRIALFSYAKVPWLKPHQKAIKEDTLPTFQEKFAIYADARENIVNNGYVAIGMDHFALENDELAIAYRNKSLIRNFQGYSVSPAKQMIGLGVTAVGFVNGGYFQNQKDLAAYTNDLANGNLPTHRGCLLTEEDLFRKEMIHSLMCTFTLQKNPRLLSLLHEKEKELREFMEWGLLEETADALHVTPLGELFVRNIAQLFDGYTQKRHLSTTFSKAI